MRRRLRPTLLLSVALFVCMLWQPTVHMTPQVDRDVYQGTCFYYMGNILLEGVYYVYTNWRYTADDQTVRYFNIYIEESDVCGPSTPNGSAYSADGWRMVVTNYHNATVYNQSGQQVFP